MIYPIVQVGTPVLRELAKPLDRSDIGTKDFKRLVNDMVETMREAPGVGLAAPQIGLDLQLVVLEDRPDTLEELDDEYKSERSRSEVPLTVLVNPTIELIGNDTITFYEGCLSVSGFAAMTARHESVRVRALNELAEPVELNWHGWPARILQHEIDHLHGTLYIDRMDTRTFTTTAELMGDEDEEDAED